MWITYLALGLAFVGVAMAWRAMRQHGELKERIAQVNSRVYHLRREMHEHHDQTNDELTRLKFEVLKLQGNLAVTPEIKLAELSMLHPQAEQVLASFHVGGCSSCSVDPRQTLGEAAAMNGREIEPILVALNRLVNDETNGHITPDQLRTPNVQLHL